MAHGIGKALASQPGHTCHPAVTALCLNLPVHKGDGAVTCTRGGWDEGKSLDTWYGHLLEARHCHTSTQAPRYLRGLHVGQAVLRTTGLVTIQQDGPAVHEHGVSLVH